MIRSELDVLLDKVDDPALQADLRKQIERLQARRSFGLVFVRIESVARVGDDSLRSLDLTESSVRDAVRAFEGGKVTALYESSTAKPYL